MALVDELATRRVPLLVHRRNVGRPAVFLPAPRADAGDILTKQIVARTHSPKRAYIARTLVRGRFRGVADIFPLPDTAYRRLARTRTLGQVRLWEAEHSRKYWRKYFAGLGHPDVTRPGHARAGVRRKSRTGCPAIFRQDEGGNAAPCVGRPGRRRRLPGQGMEDQSLGLEGNMRRASFIPAPRSSPVARDFSTSIRSRNRRPMLTAAFSSACPS